MPSSTSPTSSPRLDPEVAARPAVDDAETWPRFVARYHGFLERIAVRALRGLGLRPDPDRVDDVTQEAYCRLLEMQRRRGPVLVHWNEPARVRAFLRRVIWSVVVDERRRRNTAKRGGSYRVASPVAPDGTCVLDGRPAAGPDPEERLLRREELEGVRRCLRLAIEGPQAERNRRIAEMVVLEGSSARDVVERLERSAEAPITPSGLYSVMRRLRLGFVACGPVGVADRATAAASVRRRGGGGTASIAGR